MSEKSKAIKSYEKQSELLESYELHYSLLNYIYFWDSNISTKINL